MFVVRRFLVSPAFARLVARESSEPQDRVVTKETGVLDVVPSISSRKEARRRRRPFA